MRKREREREKQRESARKSWWGGRGCERKKKKKKLIFFSFFISMEKQRICKICNRRFSNGKAMGGHMRSHLAKLPVPPKPVLRTSNSSESTPPSQSPSSSSSLNLIPGKNPKPFYRSLNRELSQDSAIHDHKDSETESQSKNLTRRRSKRSRKEVVKVAREQVSSISAPLSEEDVALCLLTLSKDKWGNKTGRAIKEEEAEDDELLEDDDEEEEEEEVEVEEEEDDEPLCRSRTRTRNKFECETCKKVFRSYQALGGHRASHKKIVIKTQIFEGELSKSGNGGDGGGLNYAIEHRTFECPYCNKVFDSGQALGGHKKVHFANLSTTRNIASTNFKDNLVIDLNLPAPEEDEEVSTVSDY